jgi:putative transposase
MIVRLAWNLLQWCGLLLRPRESLEAEILFLRRQLALYRERGVKPRRVDAATRVTLTLLSRWFDWRSALVVVQPGQRRMPRCLQISGTRPWGRSLRPSIASIA